MQFTFRQIFPTDQPEVMAVFKRAAEKIHKKNVDHWQYWHNPPQEKLDWLEEGLRNKEYFFIENETGTRIGMVRILDEDQLYWGEQTEKAKYVHSLVVEDAYNGQGLGAKILEAIATQAKAQGCRYLRLDADARNPRLCRYYEALGFEHVGQKKLTISSYNLYQREL